MNLVESIGASAWAQGLKTVKCCSPTCGRWLTQRQLSVRRVGITMEDAWYCGYRCLFAAVERRCSKLMIASPAARSHPANMHFGYTLVRHGLLTDAQYKSALQIQNDSREEMGELVVRLGLLDERQVTGLRAAQWNCPVFPCTPGTLLANGIPRTLMLAHAMVPVHYIPTGNKLFVGFAHGVEYGPLFSVQQITGCTTQPCILAPSDFKRLIAAPPAAIPSKEMLFEDCENSHDMARSLCNYGASIDADHIAMSRCRDYIWARFKNGTKCSDLLFKMS